MKKVVIFALATITLAVFTACINPFLPGAKEKPSGGGRGTDDTFAVTIGASLESDGSVTLTADVSGDGGGTLRYQWYANSVDSNEGGISLYGERGESYEPPTDSTGTTYYYVKVTNTLNGKDFVALSNTIGIRVSRSGVFEVLVSEAEIPTVTIAASNDGSTVTLTAAAAVSDGGTLTYQWYRNTDDRSDGGTLIAGATNTTYTPPVTSNGTTYYYVKATNTLNGRTASAVSHTVRITIQDGQITEVITSDTVETPEVSITASTTNWNVTLNAFASVNDGGTITYRWYKNTFDDSSRGGTFIAGATGTIYAPPDNTNGTAYYYVKATNTLNGQTASAVSNTIKIVVQGGKIIIEEIVVSDTAEFPVVSVTASEGWSVTLMATAFVSDGGTLTYQWYRNTVNSSKNGALIIGATETTYTPTDTDGTAYYYVKVTNNLKGQTASVESNTVKIVAESGGIIEVVISDTVETPVVNIASSVNGRDVELRATATISGEGTLTYQWYRTTTNSSKSGTPIAGQTGTTYIPPKTPIGTTYYYIKVTNTLNGQTASVSSNTARVTIQSGGATEVVISDSVETPVVNITASVDGTKLNAIAFVSDGGTLTYQWYSNSQRNKEGVEIAGATRTTYTPPTAFPGTTYYYVEVTSTLKGQTASATSNIIGIAVPAGGGPVEIIRVDAEVETPKISIAASISGGNVTLTATAFVSDGGILSYQWYSNTQNSNTNGTPIANATETVYLLTTDTLGTTYYYCVATNTLNGKTSRAESNIVEMTETVKISIAATVSGRYVTLTAIASVSEGGILSYQWHSNTVNDTNGTPIADATETVYSLTMDTAGTTYYYCVATNTLNGKTSSAESNIVEITVTETQIGVADINITAPVKAHTPDTTATTDDAGYTAGAVAWRTASGPHTSPFVGGAVYTASLTLTAREGYVFAGNNFTAMINGSPADVLNKSDSTVTLSLTFDPTMNSAITTLTIITQPRTTYYHGEKLDLAALVIKVDYDDATSETGTYAALSAHDRLGTNISAVPANGEPLHRSTRNGHPVEITAGGKTANTGNLTINPKGLTVTGVSHTKVYNGNTTATGAITVTSFTGREFDDEGITGITGITGVYTSADAGTTTMTITSGVGTLQGGTAEARANYTIAASTAAVTGGITKATPTVTCPTGLEGIYGSALSTITIPINNNGYATGVDGETVYGTFTWTTPNTLVGNRGTQTHQMTFTPASGNYNTRNGNASITVNPKGLTITSVEHTKAYNGNANANNIAHPQSLTTLNGVESSDVGYVSVASLTGVYTSASAGTTTMDISAGTLSGSRANNYYVAASYNVTVTGGGITGNSTLTVNWPTGMTGVYGNTLSTVTISGGSASAAGGVNVPGAFTWTTPTNIVGNAGTQQHSMTFTPTNMVDFPTTETSARNVTVTPKPITVTVGTPSRTLIPFDGTSSETTYGTTATFTVSVSELVGDDTLTINLGTVSFSSSAAATYGLSLSDNTGIANNTLQTLTVAYNGTAAVTETPAFSIGLTLGSNYTTTDRVQGVTVIDGQAVDERAIPVTADNIGGFNTYANTSYGRTRHYKLMEDITLPGTSSSGLNNWTPIGSGSNTSFTGSFDGQYHAISIFGISISTDTTATTAAQYVGMFGYLTGTVKNLGLKNTRIQKTSTAGADASSSYVGAVAGYVRNGTVENCWAIRGMQVGGVVPNDWVTFVNLASYSTSNSSRNYVGGVVGYIDGSGTVKNCYSTTGVVGASSGGSLYVGGVVGYMNGGTVQNCYSWGYIQHQRNSGSGTVTGSVGGVVGYLNAGSLTKCITLSDYIATHLNDTNAVGHVYGASSSSGSSGATFNYADYYTNAYYNNNNNAPRTSDQNGKDGESVSQYNIVDFWTTPANWGGEAWDFTDTWQGMSYTSPIRPLLKGFTASQYWNN